MIYNEDCLDTMNRMPDNHIDLVVTSPPYDSMRTYNGHSDFDFEEIAQQLFRIIKQGGVVVWVVGDQTTEGDESGTSFHQALHFKDVGFKLFDTMIYEKIVGAKGNVNSYWQSFEYMFILSKGKPKTTNLIRDRRNKQIYQKKTGTVRRPDGVLDRKKRYGNSMYSKRTNIWRYNVGGNLTTKDDFALKHPAMFPEKLAEDHIISWSNAGDLIYDPFAGSGTTGKMALKHQRRFIGSEINPEYIPIIQRRLEIWEKQTRL